MDGTVRVWETATGQVRAWPGGRRASVGSVSFSPDGQWIAVAADDRTIRVWDATTAVQGAGSAEEAACLSGSDTAARSLAFSPDGARIVSGHEDGTIAVWDWRSGTCLHLMGQGTSVDDADGVGTGSGGAHRLPSGEVDEAIRRGLDYVEALRARGRSDGEIHARLSQAGWEDGLIENLLGHSK